MLFCLSLTCATLPSPLCDPCLQSEEKSDVCFPVGCLPLAHSPCKVLLLLANPTFIICLVSVQGIFFLFVLGNSDTADQPRGITQVSSGSHHSLSVWIVPASSKRLPGGEGDTR